jgi:thiol:disulfide interchange protein
MLGPSLALAAHTHPSLILSAAQVRPGETVMAGIRLQMDPGWHTYWRNPGGPGIPTSVEWTLPPGITAGEIQWPIPEKLSDKDTISFLYQDEVVLLVPLSIGSGASSGKVTISAKAKWQECNSNTCVQGSGKIEAPLDIGNISRASSDTALIDKWRQKLPTHKSDVVARAWWEKPAAKDVRPVILEWSTAGVGKDSEFYPYASEKYDIGWQHETVSTADGKIAIRTDITNGEGKWPDRIDGILVSHSANGPMAYETSFIIGSSDGKAAGSSAAPPLWFLLVNAFLGGMILNVMPCVLPVIALKILGFVSEAKEQPGQVRKFGLIYAGGVLFSFLIMAVLAIAAGKAASWGMLFQIPQFVLAMTVLVTLIALNLFGVFEVNMGGNLMGAASDLAARKGGAGAFFNGVLATVLATPCTAPFLAFASGFVLSLRSPALILLVFLTIGLGLAAPYLILSWNPAWLKFVPKPGVWMERFKIAMGFPILATAIWLFTLAAPNFGEDAPFWLGMLLLLVALAAWIWGQFVQRGRSRRTLAMAISLAILVFGGSWVLEGELHWRHPMVTVTDSDVIKYSPDGIEWHKWSPEAVQAARAKGRPILVDFTASWCNTCLYNLHTSIEIPSVRTKLKEINAIAFVENSYTKNQTVVDELNRYERAGVPLVLVYPCDPNASPQVLPAILTSGIVLDALDKAARQKAARAADTASSH